MHYVHALTFNSQLLTRYTNPETALEREDNQRNQSSAAATCQKAKKETTVFS